MITTLEAPKTEVSSLISSCLWQFYGAHLPPRLAKRLVESQLIDLQVSFWTQLLIAEDTAALRNDMRRRASLLDISEETLTEADMKIIWEITPEIAASLACAPGTDVISLRKIANALHSIFAAALSSTQIPIIYKSDYSKAA